MPLLSCHCHNRHTAIAAADAEALPRYYIAAAADAATLIVYADGLLIQRDAIRHYAAVVRCFITPRRFITPLFIYVYFACAMRYRALLAARVMRAVARERR